MGRDTDTFILNVMERTLNKARDIKYRITLTPLLPFVPFYAIIVPMLAKVTSGAVVGLDGAIVEVEVDILPGLPKTIIVGLPDTAVEESAERVRSAIRNSGGFYPGTRVVVNLAQRTSRKPAPLTTCLSPSVS